MIDEEPAGIDSVYTVARYRVTALSKALDDLRDKRVANFDSKAARTVTASWPDGRVTLVRDGEDADWRLTAPLEGPADQTTVDARAVSCRYRLAILSSEGSQGLRDVPVRADV